MKFKFTSEMTLGDTFCTSSEFECEHISDVVDNFKLFLKGVGYSEALIETYLTGDTSDTTYR